MKYILILQYLVPGISFIISGISIFFEPESPNALLKGLISTQLLAWLCLSFGLLCIAYFWWESVQLKNPRTRVFRKYCEGLWSLEKVEERLNQVLNDPDTPAEDIVIIHKFFVLHKTKRDSLFRKLGDIPKNQLN